MNRSPVLASPFRTFLVLVLTTFTSPSAAAASAIFRTRTLQLGYTLSSLSHNRVMFTLQQCNRPPREVQSKRTMDFRTFFFCEETGRFSPNFSWKRPRNVVGGEFP